MKRVVIIDDSPMILELAKRALDTTGYEVDALEDPGDFDPTAGPAPALVLVDINMPQFYGDDVVVFIREAWAVDAAIYLFSNVPEKELKERASACGADGYISQDGGLDAMVEKVEQIIGKP